MNIKELYALCYVLMGDDNPRSQSMLPINRKFLSDYADQRARELGCDGGWVQWYMETEMPFTEQDHNEAMA